MDDADRSDTRIQAAIDDGIENARIAMSKTKLLPCGSCHWCGESVSGSQLFCDDIENGCAKDWQHDHDRRKASGL